MNKKAQQDGARKLRVLNHAKDNGNIAKAYRFQQLVTLAWLPTTLTAEL